MLRQAAPVPPSEGKGGFFSGGLNPTGKEPIMATARLVHRHRLSDTHVRELAVYYDKGGMNYWDYSRKPKGIYFSASLYQDVEGSAFKTWTSGRAGDGYILVEPLDRYRPRRSRTCARACSPKPRPSTRCSTWATPTRWRASRRSSAAPRPTRHARRGRVRGPDMSIIDMTALYATMDRMARRGGRPPHDHPRRAAARAALGRGHRARGRLRRLRRQRQHRGAAVRARGP